MAKIHVVRDDLDDVARYRIAPSQVPDEIGRFETALIQTRMQILEMQQRIAESIGAKDAAIFDAHLLVVEDRTLIDEVLRKLETDLCNVEWVFQEVATRYAETLNKIDDPYLRARAGHSGRDKASDSQPAGQGSQDIPRPERSSTFLLRTI